MKTNADVSTHMPAMGVRTLWKPWQEEVLRVKRRTMVSKWIQRNKRFPILLQGSGYSLWCLKVVYRLMWKEMFPVFHSYIN